MESDGTHDHLPGSGGVDPNETQPVDLSHETPREAPSNEENAATEATLSDTPGDTPAETPDEEGTEETPAVAGTARPLRAGSRRATRRREDAPPPPGDPRSLWAAIGLILAGLVVGAIIFAVNRNHDSKTASNIPTPIIAPTVAPIPTPVIKGGDIAATVNGKPITTSNYRTLLNLAVKQSAGQPGAPSTKIMGSQVLNSLIQDEIVQQYATAHHIRVASTALNKQIAQYKVQQHGEKGFTAWLKRLGLTYAQLKYLVTGSLLQQKVQAVVAKPSNAPIQTAHARHILVGINIPGHPKRTDKQALARAQQLLAQLHHGASFAALAKKASDDTSSGQKGGDLGTVLPGEMVPPFEHAVFTLPLNIPTIVHTQFGYHIVEVLSRSKEAPPATVKQQRAQQAYQAWMNSQIKAAKIKRLVTVS